MDKTLPSPLTAFEEYMLLDGTADHPMEFFFRLRFDGGMRREDLEAAADEAVARHPLLAARIDRRGGGRPRFVAAAADARRPAAADRTGLELVHTAVALGDFDAYPALAPLDPLRGPLVRLTLVTATEAATADGTGPVDLIAQFHHAACDGLGALDFLDDLLELCDARLAGRPPRLDRLDPGRLRSRGRFGLDAWSLLVSLPRQARGLEGVWKFLGNRPVRLQRADGKAAAHGPVARCPATVSVACDAATTAALRRLATREGVSLNELAACELFRSLREALPATPSGSAPNVAAGGVIRLSVPMNLRRASDRRLPAANVVSMVFLDRSAGQIDDPAGLLRSIHEEMQLIRRLGLGMTFIFTLWAARRLPGGIARLVRNQRTAATALFTNIGRIFRRAARSGGGTVRIGKAALVSVDCLAPLRRGTALAVTAAERGDSLCFTLRYDPDALSRDWMTGLRDAFRSRMELRAGQNRARAATIEPPVLEPVP